MTQRGGEQRSSWVGWFGCHMPLQTVLCACMGVYGCVCTICMHASFHVCAVKCKSVCCVIHSAASIALFAVMQQKHSCNRPSCRLPGCRGEGGGAKEDGRVKGDVLACYRLYVQTLLAQDQIPSVYRMPFPLWQFCFLHLCV